MRQTRNAAATRSVRVGLAKLADTLADAIAEQVRRAFEALGPQPQVQPIPVRAAVRRRPSRL